MKHFTSNFCVLTALISAVLSMALLLSGCEASKPSQKDIIEGPADSGYVSSLDQSAEDDDAEELPFIAEAVIVYRDYIEDTDKYHFSCAAKIDGYGDVSTPFTFSVSKDRILNEDGNPASEEDIESFTHLDIYFNGEFMESYPMQIAGAEFVFGSSDASFTEEDLFEYEKLFDIGE